MSLFRKSHLQVIKDTGVYLSVNNKVSRPQDIINMVSALFPEINYGVEERFIVLFLDTKNTYLNGEVVSIGSLNASIVHPREVFKRALLYNSASIVCVHNHPSGVTTPSKEDDSITQRLDEAGRLLGIPVIDHIIVGDNNYYSFKEDNKL